MTTFLGEMSMKKIGVVAVGLVLASGAAVARDTVLHLPLAEVLAMPEAEGKLDGSVKFYLAGAAHPSVKKQLGDDVANKKTNGVGKSDEYGCRWAALSALLAFQESAKKRGADAVINLVSYYKKREFKSSTEYECHAGGVVVGVALKGEYASLGR
ncbi:MAG: excinuclease ATPase subunit [Steroidobacteraceae bacterium]